MQLRAVRIGLVLGGLLASASALAERPAVVETCLGCHGIAGYKNAYPTYHVPKLGGQHAQYIADALRAYASGNRPHSTMHANAATLSEDEIEAIAKWFEEQGR
jgi:cytochrome c553